MMDAETERQFGDMRRDRTEKLRAQLSERERLEGGWADQLSRALGLLEDLDTLAEQLQMKLDPVLMEDHPTPQPGERAVAAAPTQLAMHLQQLADRLESLRGRLGRTLQRVEL
jgi:hypothetical protein